MKRKITPAMLDDWRQGRVYPDPAGEEWSALCCKTPLGRPTVQILTRGKDTTLVTAVGFGPELKELYRGPEPEKALDAFYEACK